MMYNGDQEFSTNFQKNKKENYSNKKRKSERNTSLLMTRELTH